jgi:hypothetical protein
MKPAGEARIACSSSATQWAELDKARPPHIACQPEFETCNRIALSCAEWPAPFGNARDACMLDAPYRADRSAPTRFADMLQMRIAACRGGGLDALQPSHSSKMSTGKHVASGRAHKRRTSGALSHECRGCSGTAPTSAAKQTAERRRLSISGCPGRLARSDLDSCSRGIERDRPAKRPGPSRTARRRSKPLAESESGIGAAQPERASRTEQAIAATLEPDPISFTSTAVITVLRRRSSTRQTRYCDMPWCAGTAVRRSDGRDGCRCRRAVAASSLRTGYGRIR